MKTQQILLLTAIASGFASSAIAQSQLPNNGDIHTAQRYITQEIESVATNRQVVKECGIDLSISSIEILEEGIALNPEYPVLGEIIYGISFFPRGSGINPEFCNETLKSLLGFQFNGKYLNPIGADSLAIPHFYQFRFLVPSQGNF